MSHYQHSVVFAEMKAIDEDIKVNLTSNEYLQVLDYFLKKAWKPLLLGFPEFCNGYLSKVLFFSVTRSAIKLSSEEKSIIAPSVLKILASEGERRCEYFESVHFNRGVIFGMILLFLQLGERVIKAQDLFNDTPRAIRDRETLSVFEQLNIYDSARFLELFGEIQYWYDKAREFRQQICQKYTRFALMQAKKAYEQYDCKISLNDVSIIYIMTVGRAVDRCDSRLGVLTTFIQNWLKSAQCQTLKLTRQEDDHLSLDGLQESYGDSVSIPSYTMDTSDEGIDDIAYKAKQIDPVGVLRASLGIPEFLSYNDRQFLESLSVEAN